MFNLFKKDPAEKFLDVLENSLNLTYLNRNPKLSESAVWQSINELNAETRKKIGILAIKKIIHAKDYEELVRATVRKKIFKQEVVNKIADFTQIELSIVLQELESVTQTYYLPLKDILAVFKYYKIHFGRDIFYQKSKSHLNKIHDSSPYGHEKDFKDFIRVLNNLEQDPAIHYPFDATDILGVKMAADYAELSPEIKEVLHFCWSEKQKSQPTNKWLSQAKQLIANAKNLAEQQIVFARYLSFINESGRALVRWLHSLPITEQTERLAFLHTHCEFTNALEDFRKHRSKFYVDEQNYSLLSHLIYYCTLLNDTELNSLISKLAFTSFQKIRWQGNLSDKIGNVCLFAFTLMPKQTGIINLLAVKNKIPNKAVKNTASKHLRNQAASLKLTEDALLELSTTDFGITDKKIIHDFGDFHGVITIPDLENLSIHWVNKNKNAAQKSIPKEVKAHFLKESKDFTSLLKDIGTAYQVHKTRLENTYINNTSWTLADWSTYYIDHPFLSYFNANLIWFFDEKETLIKRAGCWINEKAEVVDLEQFSSVRLWHPIFSPVNVVEKWRTFILNNEIKQPFKQAYREVYRLTDAEIRTETYSNRFAAHILFQHKFSALCKTREWQYSLQGDWDSSNTPFKNLPAHGIKIEFWLQTLDTATNQTGVYTYVATDQVRFHTARAPLPMQSVPELVLTEMMRDIDLFVGVCSIGNNPEWQDGGETARYWTTYSFGDLSTNAQTRKQVLEQIIPKLKIASVCSFSEKYLEVKGKIRSYKIHCGSGNILMTPNDQYLCIVPNAGAAANRIFLPFDDDRTLSIILSKAFLLADDDKITDPTITRQISLKA